MIINNYKIINNKATQKQLKSKCIKSTICRLLLCRLLSQQTRLMELKELIQVFNTLLRVSNIIYHPVLITMDK